MICRILFTNLICKNEQLLIDREDGKSVARDKKAKEKEILLWELTATLFDLNKIYIDDLTIEQTKNLYKDLI